MSINTDLYCRTNTGRDVVEEGPALLPETYRVPGDTVTKKNFNNDDVHNDDSRRASYWYPYVENDSPKPGEYYDRVLSDFMIGPMTVSRDVSWEQWDIERVRAQKSRELSGHLGVYDQPEMARQLAVDELLASPIRDTTEWVSGREVVLAQLDTWEDVANFDTSKPDPLPLTNNYVGAQLAQHGVRLQGENDAVIAAGGDPLYDVTSLNDFIAGNVSAGQDVTGGTQPVPATFSFRQALSQPNERINTLVLTREYKGFPGAEWGWKATLKRNGDSKPLYIFSYLLGGAYLAWKLFQETSPGIWEAVSHSSEDRSSKVGYEFVLSYGTNPAIEADWFTSKMPFPENSDEEVRRIRYDD